VVLEAVREKLGTFGFVRWLTFESPRPRIHRDGPAAGYLSKFVIATSPILVGTVELQAMCRTTWSLRPILQQGSNPSRCSSTAEQVRLGAPTVSDIPQSRG